jgi:hypothetical protein
MFFQPFMHYHQAPNPVVQVFFSIMKPREQSLDFAKINEASVRYIFWRERIIN